MVTRYGFSEVGPYSLSDPSARSGDVVMRLLERKGVSETLQRRVDNAVARIVAEAYVLALQFVREHRDVLDRSVQVLMEKETVSGDEFRALLQKLNGGNADAVVNDRSDPLSEMVPSS